MKKQYKTELHCHSFPVSQCANTRADKVVEMYLEAGYDTIVLVNHINHCTFSGINLPTWKEKMDCFMEGYHDLQKAAEGTGINILLGAEVSLAEASNDYLCFGVTEEFLYAEDFMSWSIAEFAQHAHNHGVLVYQAHPFRPLMRVVNPAVLDGFEIFNGHPGHNSQNTIAKAWAETYGKPGVSGSDHHADGQPVNGGIITEIEIKDNATLLDVLKSGSYTLIEG